MLLKVLVVALVALALTGTVAAQEPERACGDFDYSEQETQQHVTAADILEDLKSCDVLVMNSIVDGDLILWRATIEHGLDFNDVVIMGEASFFSAAFQERVSFSRTIFAGKVDCTFTTFEADALFRDTTFEDDAAFYYTTFKGGAYFDDANFAGNAHFVDANFAGNAHFGNANFKGNAVFSGETGATFEGRAYFVDANFADVAIFRKAKFTERLVFDPRINGEMWPPASGLISTNLTWNQVKGTFPEGENLVDMYARWENFFTLANKASEARKVRTAQRRYELRFWVWSVAAGLGGSWLLFAILYCWRFKRYRRWSILRHIWKMLLCSLDVISPSIRPWKYDWDRDGGLDVRRVAVITAVERAPLAGFCWAWGQPFWWPGWSPSGGGTTPIPAFPLAKGEGACSLPLIKGES